MKPKTVRRIACVAIGALSRGHGDSAFCGVLAGILLTLAAFSAVPAYASVIFGGTATASGAGIGTSNVVMTLQGTGTEAGCIGFGNVIGGSACPGGLSPAISGGNEKTGNSQTQTRTISELGVQSGESLVIVLNVSEPPGGELLTVENLSLTVWSPTGTILFNSGNLFGAGTPPSGGIALDSSLQGQGVLGFAFIFDSAQASAIDPFLCTNALIPGCNSVANAANANNVIGLSALITDTSGGNETLSVADLANVTVTPPTVPEPATLALLGLGLAGLGFSRRKQ